MHRSLARAATAFALVALAADAPAIAEEGMWTFDRFPAARMQTEMGWAPDQPWLDRVMAGTARLPGCSGANVSAGGLLLTNHHCVITCVRSLSSAESDYLGAGFMARTREEERRCPGLQVSVLSAIADVTPRIDSATAGIPADAFAQARDGEITRIESECSRASRRCEVVTLYHGGRYGLYTYKRYDDVRLVFAPEHAMAAFGGDADNFNFPRYGLDFAFLRLYENNAPAATPRHLRMRFTPLEDNEIVLVTGNPGGTSRLLTTAELAFHRDVALPWRLGALTEARSRLIQYAAQGPDQARLSAPALQSVENTLKGLEGRRLALMDEAGFARVRAREADLQARVQRNRAAQREVGDAWGEIGAAQTAYRAFYHAHQHLDYRPAERSDLFLWARDIVRGAAERAKPSAERIPRYADARLGGVLQSLRAERPVDPAFEELNLALWLSKMREDLSGDPVLARVLGDEAPDALARRLAQSGLADPAERVRLWQGGAAAVAASTDPMIVFARAWDSDARAVRERYVTEVEGPNARAQERIARARFRAFGENAYPDATFSPRLSYGRIAGWTDPDGSAVAPFTRLSGLYERATGHAPYALSPRWIGARARLNPNVIYNAASTNDIIGGSSGSALLDRDGRVVGAAFDGNRHSLGGEYYYDGALNRMVSVGAEIMRAALADVYGMEALLAELEAE